MKAEDFQGIHQGLLEAIDLAQGKPTGARVHQVEVPEAPTNPRLSKTRRSGKFGA